MTIRSHRLANALARIFFVLRILCIVALALLIPAMIVAWIYPESINLGAGVKVNGVPLTESAPALAGTVILFANAALLAAVVILGKLRGMMKSVVAGLPFTIENVGRLRTIAGTMGALLIAQTFAGLFISTAQRTAYAIPAGRFDFGLFLGMLVLLVLAEVFREGVRLREDAEGTI
jgi:hypothetical protein